MAAAIVAQSVNPEDTGDEPKNPTRVAAGSLGGKARAKSLDGEQRSDAARAAVAVRWNHRPAADGE